MREILFRGKRLDTGEWCEGCYLETLRYNNLHWIWDGKAHVAVDPATIGQYTGIKDKNGRRVFEGDILESRYDPDYPEDFCRETVVWHDHGWHFIQDNYDPEPFLEESVLPCSVVAGNIYDNLDLIGGKLPWVMEKEKDNG